MAYRQGQVEICAREWKECRSKQGSRGEPGHPAGDFLQGKRTGTRRKEARIPGKRRCGLDGRQYRLAAPLRLPPAHQESVSR